ncbi:hypothetical protein BU23DRAFT_585385 [Bimuria novae-zelandiae CBS 107.79]|uniref:lytic cellulose monooxygenase (C4-dehydrogenating) n=1 Tax=Bimuria novae-zelandiae CBS 107.79 TaxID=1447943 RepID=A0A6A5UJA5_9PLEO|nr:hypothetical protein BU23DRAFT_585385 [Bimuria novae-zelandiae CBS 107.79]
MRFLGALLLGATASAHYTFPALVAGGSATPAWQYVRKTSNYQSNGPVTDVTSNAIRCYELSPGSGMPATYEVAAGSSIGFTVQSSISHPGTLQFYMARIFEQGPTIGAGGLTWPSQGKAQVSVPIPKNLPSGEYLFRVEHIALHSAGAAGGAQFYISCAQVKVINGGNGSPGPLVSFPGAYKATDPGIMLNIYYPVPTSYTPPGPKVWTR